MSNVHIDDSVIRWSIHELREIIFDPTTTMICARSLGMMQRVYPFSENTNTSLKLRYSLGFPLQINLSSYLWVVAIDEHDEQVEIAIDPSYIFDRTGCYVSQKVFKWGGAELVPISQIVEGSVSELMGMLHLRVKSTLSLEVDVSHVKSYLALDFKHENKVILFSKPKVIDRLEEAIRTYSSRYWEDFSAMGSRVQVRGSFYLNPIKQWWTLDALGSVDVGDLISIENFHRSSGSVQIRGLFSIVNRFNQSTFCMEVFLQMNTDETQLYFSSDEQSRSEEKIDSSSREHENIELEIYAGGTTISFNDLCAVQAGTLIELRDHSLPFVKLCVMGSPILEGELVNFQDQIMIQITKRLD